MTIVCMKDKVKKSNELLRKFMKCFQRKDESNELRQISFHIILCYLYPLIEYKP